MSKQFKGGRTLICAMLSFLMLFSPVQNVIATEPVQLIDCVSNANKWLSESQRADGAWKGEYYTDCMFYTSKISRYFKQEGLSEDISDKADAFLRGLNEEKRNNYYAALLAGAFEEDYRKEIIGSLVTAQKYDGGWGITGYYESDVLDSIEVLETLIEESSEITSIKSGIDYLLQTQKTDGSWSFTDGSNGSTVLTAQAVILLNKFTSTTGLTSTSLESAMFKAGEYLESKQGEDGTWGVDEESIEDTLLAYRAVLLTLGIDPVSTVEDTIVALQQENGSWYEDGYITMLAAKALKERRMLPVAQINDIKLYGIAGGDRIETYSYNPYEAFDIEVDFATDNIDSKILLFINRPDGTKVSISSNGKPSWNTVNNLPGEYSVEALIKDNTSGRVMARYGKTFTINPGFNADNVVVSLNPHFTRVDKPVKVNAEIYAENLSNINKQVDICTAVYSGDTIVEYSTKTVNFDLTDSMPVVGTISFNPDVSTEKEYIIRSFVFDGTEKITEGQNSFKVLPLADLQSFDYTLMQGEEVSEVLNVVIPEMPPKADVMFAFDLTGSMSGILNTAKSKAKTIMTELNKLGVDINYGVISYMDYLYGSYGAGNDYPYSLDCPLTESMASVSDSINSLRLGSGNDGPESYTRVLYESYADTNIGWRSGAKKIFVNFGDSVPHDDNINEGVPGKSGIYNTGIDIGRDGKINTEDDLDLQDVLAEMAANKIELIACQTNGAYGEYWSYWAGLTGGRMYDTNSANMADDVVRAVTESLMAPEIYDLKLVPSVGFDNWLTNTSLESYSGATDTVVPFKVDIKAPLGTPKGMYTYKIDAIDDNGVKYATYNFNIDVVTDEVAPIVRTTVSTDKEQYLPDSKVSITTTSKNITNSDADFTGKVEIIDINGELVKLLEDNIQMHWSAYETRDLSFVWNTGKTVSGKYKVKITWTNEENEYSSYAEFKVSPDGEVNNAVSTDKTSYYDNEKVNILETIKNKSKNAIMSDLYVQTRITDFQGNSVWSDERLLVELLPGNTTRISKNWSVENIRPGNYTVTSAVYEAVYREAAICSSFTNFEILPSDGTRLGLIGKIEAAPKIIKPDGSVVLSRTISNTGNTEIKTVDRKVIISDPVTGDVVDTIQDTVYLGISDTISDLVTWSKTGVKEGNYLVSFQAELPDGSIVILGSTGFKVESLKPTPNAGGKTATNKTPTPTPSQAAIPTNDIPAAGPVDLAVVIMADKTVYTELEEITFTVKYRNVLETGTGTFKITAEIPEGLEVSDTGDGKVEGNIITWEIPGFMGKNSGQKVFKVRVGELSKPETIVSSTAEITGASGLINTEDDRSTIKVMLRTAKYGSISHKAYIKGYPGNVFKPENDLTRAEAATIFAKIMGLSISGSDNKVYTDVDETHWAKAYIEAVTDAGIFKGYGDNTFRPEGSITRAELATAAAKYLGLKDINPFEESYNDIKGHWARNYIEEIKRFKLIEGYEDGSFRPEMNIKRSETVAIINNMLFRGPLEVDTSTFRDIKVTDWFFSQVEESARDHEVTFDDSGNEVPVR